MALETSLLKFIQVTRLDLLAEELGESTSLVINFCFPEKSNPSGVNEALSKFCPKYGSFNDGTDNRSIDGTMWW